MITISVQKKQIHVIIIDLALAVMFFSFKIITALMLKHLPKCIFLQYGIVCPSCGGTRSVRNFVSGNFLLSFKYNPFVFLVIIYALAGIVMFNIAYLFQVKSADRIFKKMISATAIIAFAVGYVVFGLVRNLILL